MLKKFLVIGVILPLFAVVLGFVGLSTVNAAPPVINHDATLVIDNRTGHDIVVNIEEKVIEESWNEDLTKATLWVAADTQHELMLRPAEHKYNVGEVTGQLNFGDNGNGWFDITSGDTLYLTCNAAGCDVMTPDQFMAMSTGSADNSAQPAAVSAPVNKGTLNFINDTGHDVWIDVEEEIVNPLRADEATKAHVVVPAEGEYSFNLNPAHHQFIVDRMGPSLELGDNGNGVFDIATDQTLTLRCNAAKCEFVNAE